MLEVRPPRRRRLPRGGGAGDQHPHAGTEDGQDEALGESQVPAEKTQVLLVPGQLPHDDRDDHGDDDAGQEPDSRVSENGQQIQGHFGGGFVGGKHADNRSRCFLWVGFQPRF